MPITIAYDKCLACLAVRSINQKGQLSPVNHLFRAYKLRIASLVASENVFKKSHQISLYL
jgi:hypothetical protein